MDSIIQQQMKTQVQNTNKEFGYSDENFKCLRELISTHTGINLTDQKSDMIYGRLTNRLRALGISRFDDYCDLLKNNPGDELTYFSNAITTNLTSFFREAHHFEFLSKKLVPQLLERYQENKRLRIWSAGCSTGEEPYSLAITLREAIPDIDKRDIRILATDLDTNVVRTADDGVYTEQRIEGLDEKCRRRWFKHGKGSQADKVKVDPSLQKLITFKQLNLMQDWPMRGQFDVIFCRNVVIYFDKPTQKVLFDRFANVMHPDSHLFIGHSENLGNVTDRFELLDKTIYRRTDR